MDFILRAIVFILFTVLLVAPKGKWKCRHNTFMMIVFLVGTGIIFLV